MIRVAIALVFGLALAGCSRETETTEAAAPEQTAAVPDFYRSGTPWSTGNGKDFFPPPPGSPGAAGPIGDHPDHPHFGNNTGRPTPRIGDDTNPLLKPWAAEQMKKTREAIVAGGVPYDPAERCWPPGVPAVLTFGVAPMYFLQTPEEVIIVHERGQLARHVWLNQEHTPNLKPSWHGESVGHYEGDTLVVDTIGLNDKTSIDDFNVPHTDALHVVERYRIVGNELQVVVTVDDPNTFNQPFSMFKSFEAGDEDQMEEVICQEAGEDKFNTGVRPLPTAAKADF